MEIFIEHLRISRFTAMVYLLYLFCFDLYQYLKKVKLHDKLSI